jgi:hypothetical protein
MEKLLKVSNGELTLGKDLLGVYAQINDLVGNVVPVFFTLRNPKIELVKGQAGMIGAPGMENRTHKMGKISPRQRVARYSFLAKLTLCWARPASN